MAAADVAGETFGDGSDSGTGEATRMTGLKLSLFLPRSPPPPPLLLLANSARTTEALSGAAAAAAAPADNDIDAIKCAVVNAAAAASALASDAADATIAAAAATGSTGDAFFSKMLFSFCVCNTFVE